jgi:hypothetical protein
MGSLMPKIRFTLNGKATEANYESGSRNRWTATKS